MAGGKKGGQGGRGNKPGSHRKGASKGSGGQRRRALAGRGPTPKASERKGHPQARRAAAARKRAEARGGARRRTGREGSEIIFGRNSVVEALAAGVPANALLVGERIDADERVREAIRLGQERGIALLEAPRAELDRLTDGGVHQGLALQVPPYSYADLDEVLAAAEEAGEPPLVVALDGVTDPRNLGAVVRSAAAFGAHGVVVPERRSAGMTASAWKTSAGAAARVPVARVTNLTRALTSLKDAGLMVVGLAADGEVDVDDLDAATDPLVLVLGSEGRGLSRLVGETCDLHARIPMTSATESLNAGVAAGVVLHVVASARRRA